MANYHVNKKAQSTGEHEVHEDTCSHPADSENKLSLGFHLTCQGAVKAAGEQGRGFAVVSR